MSVMVRVDKDTRERIKKIARLEGRNMNEIIRMAIDKYEQDRVLDEFNEAYARVKNNPDEWADMEKERKVWDNTLMDGLE